MPFAGRLAGRAAGWPAGQGITPCMVNQKKGGHVLFKKDVLIKNLGPGDPTPWDLNIQVYLGYPHRGPGAGGIEGG